MSAIVRTPLVPPGFEINSISYQELILGPIVKDLSELMFSGESLSEHVHFLLCISDPFQLRLVYINTNLSDLDIINFNSICICPARRETQFYMYCGFHWLIYSVQFFYRFEQYKIYLHIYILTNRFAG